MTPDNFLEHLVSHLGKITSLKFLAKFGNIDKEIILKVKWGSEYATWQFDYTHKGYRELLDDHGFLTKISDNILDDFEAIVLADLQEEVSHTLAMCIEFEKKYLADYEVPDTDTLNSPCQQDILEKVCCQVFTNRIRVLFSAVSPLILDVDIFLKYDLATAILFRSALLDGIHMTCWYIEPEYIRHLVSESFGKGNLPKDIDTKLLEEYELLAKHYNPDGKKYHRNKVLAVDPQAKEILHLYSLYSKYDHFSLIPGMLQSNEIKKLMLAMEAVQYVRSSLIIILERYGYSSFISNIIESNE